jgi:hypothetical protein
MLTKFFYHPSELADGLRSNVAKQMQVCFKQSLFWGRKEL